MRSIVCFGYRFAYLKIWMIETRLCHSTKMLYCTCMKRKILFTIGFLFHSLVASFCIMPTTFAAEMPMPQEKNMEMVMTPMFQMSPIDCTYCIQMTNQNDLPIHESCAGHCLANAHDILFAVIPPSAHSSPATVAHTLNMYSESSRTTPSILTSMSPPRHLAITRTMVMIQ